MGEWPRVKVSNVCSKIVDCVNRTAPAVDFPTGFRMIRTTNVRHGRIDLSSCKYVDEETFKRWNRRALVEDGDIILTREAPIGEVGYIKDLGSVFLGQRIMQFKPDAEFVDPRFLFYAFRSPELQHQFGVHEGSGSVVSHIRVADCFEFLVPLPTLTEQKAIAQLLGALDDKIELNRRMNETLEAMVRALFKDWFVDFGPTRAKMARRGEAPINQVTGGEDPQKENVAREPYLAPDLWDLFPVGLDADGKPEGWKEGTLAEITDLNPESWSDKDPPFDVRYVDLSNTKWGDINKVEDFTWAEAPSRARRVLRRNDVIVGTVRPANGAFAIVGDDGLTGSTGFAVLRPKRTADYAFVWAAATAPDNIDRLAHLADGAAYPAVRPGIVAETPIAIASQQVFAAFSDLVNPLLDRAQANRFESQSLAQTRDLLLPKLMSGEIRLQDAEKQVEAVA